MKLKNPSVMKNQKGVILLLSLFMMAMIEVIVIFVLMKYRHVIYGATNFNASIQAMTYAKGVEDQLINKLLKIKSVKDKDKKVPFTKLNLSMEFDGGYAQAELADAQGKLNLNNLIEESAMMNFGNMLAPLSESTKSDIDKALLSFIQERVQYYSLPKEQTLQENEGWGIDAYMMKDKSIQQPQQQEQISSYQQKTGKKQRKVKPDAVPFSVLSELLILPKMDKEIYEKLQKDLTVLPEPTPLNVNTATRNALMSLNPKMTLKIADTVVMARNQMKGFSDIGSFTEIVKNENVQIDEELITLDSIYYLSTVYVKYRNVQMTLFSLLKVTSSESAATVSIVWRSINTL